MDDQTRFEYLRAQAHAFDEAATMARHFNVMGQSLHDLEGALDRRQEECFDQAHNITNPGVALGIVR